MRAKLLLLSLSASMAASLPAHADTLIDDFRLTTPGTVITFSLPASPGASPSYGAGGVDAGFFVTPSPVVTINGTPSTSSSLEFLSGRIFVGPGLVLSTNLGSYTLVGALLYSNTSANPTFLTGSFNLNNFYGSGTPAYVLTITPEAAGTTPEPSSMVLAASGSLAMLAAMRRSRLASRAS